MIIKPKVRGFVCVTAHPEGCAAHVQEQIDHVVRSGPITDGPKKVLVIGTSTGFGLASRIALAFGARAATLGVFFDRASDNGRTATAGWYNTAAFHQKAKAEGLYAESFNGDAFSDEMKEKVIAKIKEDLGQVDLVVYSVAAPRRVHPKTGAIHKSCLKTIGEPFTSKTVDTDKGIISEITIEAGTEQDIADTVAVMGGEDWEMWMNALHDAGALAPGATTVAFDYVGPKVTWPIYYNGTIGAAKKDLRAASKRIDALLKIDRGRAIISVNKALVTQASSAIPIVPLYISLLYKVMKEKGVHEGCIEQMYRLFADKLASGKPVPYDDEGLVRMDDLEMRPDVQEAVAALWPQVTTENLESLTDIKGNREEFLKLFGFGLQGVDYEADVEIEVPIA